MKKQLLFVITQFYQGGAERALLNLFRLLSPEEFDIDFLIFDQIPLKNAVSLIPQIPSWIRVCHAAEEEGKWAILRKIGFKGWQMLTGHQCYRKKAYQFVQKKQYDLAFSYGEWMSPEFVAKRVLAKKKLIWIHTDLDQAAFIKEKILFGFDEVYYSYIFVSEQSRRRAEARFPLIKGKSMVIHNLCDEEAIRRAAKVPVKELQSYPKPWLFSVGNLREEKNYPRQVEVMRILKERGVPCTWFCIGSRANRFIDQKVVNLIQAYQLEKRFLLLGVKKNPYSYMKQADAVLVLSNFESWSLVITEAKLLGVPVIATPTSGAKEQIEEGKTGRFTSFQAEEIADTIQDYLAHPEKKEEMQRNLKGFSVRQEGISEFYRLLQE